MILLSLLMILLIALVAAILILLERRFIKQRKKLEWVLPMVVTVLAAITFVSANTINTNANISHPLILKDKGAEIGQFQVVYPKDKKEALAVSFLKLENDMKYIELEFKEGKLIGSEEALQYEEAITNATDRYIKNFTGKSVDYDEFRNIDNERLTYFGVLHWAYFLYSIMLYLTLPIILWLMVIISRQRRKKRNQLDKTKLEDL